MERSHQYKVIIDDIRTKLNPGAEKDIFESAILKWKEGQDIKSYQEFLGCIQKLKKNILERMAPSDAIRASTWYEDSKDDGVIMHEHKIKYIQQKSYPDQLFSHTRMSLYALSELVWYVEKQVNIWDSYYENFRNKDYIENIDKKVEEVLVILNRFLAAISVFYTTTEDHLADLLIIDLVTEILDEYDDESDILPDHEYLINELEVKNIEIIDFGSGEVHLKAKGNMVMSIDSGPLLQGEDPPLAGTTYDFPFHIIINFLLDPDEEEEPFRIEEFQPDVEARTVVVN